MKQKKYPFYNLNPYGFSLKLVNEMVKSKKTDSYEKGIMDLFLSQIDTNYNESLRLIEVDEQLIPLLQATDNNIFYRPLFFPSIFINCELKIKEYVIKGITVIDQNEISTKIRVGNDIVKLLQNQLLLSLVVNTNTKQVYYLFDELVLDHFRPKLIDGMLIVDHIRNFICNIIDFVEGNKNDIGVKTIYPSEKQQQKRKEKTKAPTPIKILIKPKKHFIRYISKFNNDSRLTHKFLVRGHWRHFRNKKYSDFKRQNPKWIKPYYKGTGIVVNKSYLIKNV